MLTIILLLLFIRILWNFRYEASPAIVDILNVFDKEFPVKLVLAFSPGENESEEETQEEDLPDISQIESIVESLGVGSFEIEDLRQGVYQITLTEFKHNFDSKNFREFDSQDLQNIVNPFFSLGSIYQASLTGGVVKFSITGGVEEAKKLIGETALLEFKERDSFLEEKRILRSLGYIR